MTSRSLPDSPQFSGLALPEATPAVGLEGSQPTSDIDSWKRRLAGAPALNLPTDHSRSSAAGSRYAEGSLCINSQLSAAVRQFAQRESSSVSTVLLAAYCVLLHRYTLQDDLLLGCTLEGTGDLSNNGHGKARQAILRIDLSGDPGFRPLLKRVNTVLEEASWRSPSPFAAILEKLQAGDTGNSVFQASFSAQVSGNGTAENAVSMTPVDWHLEFLDRGENLTLRLIYDSELFAAQSIERALNHYQTLLQAMIESPEQAIYELPILSETERKQILVDWNQTAAETPRKCLHELIEAQAERWPERIAVVSDEQQLTYREFNARANQLAHELLRRGIGRGERVGICLGHSSAFAVAVLAVLKSGAACVPLDPDYPQERLSYMLEDVRARVLIASESAPLNVPAGCEVLVLEDESDAFASNPAENLKSDVIPDDIAYVIYSSGSTGKPKGVLLAHSGLVNYNVNAARMYSMTPDDRVLQFCSISFDIALEEIFITWLSGATLVFRTDSVPMAVPDFLKWVEQQGITVLDLPTAYWHEWVHELPQLKNKVVPQKLRFVIVGGEKPSSQAYATWLAATKNRVRWINTYGPTEISICATAYEPQWKASSEVPQNIPIGRPLANVRVYLLDRHLNPVPVGVPGEIHVAGAGVAKGYLNRPELTAQKFIRDPFSSDPQARMYKTGDLARYLPSGEIEFLGRGDDQIKIRGFRIELGEIENVLGKHAGVREAVVTAREDVPGDKQLVAYFVPALNAEPSAAELRRYLKEQLPEYMVPAAFVKLEALPLTPNGKVNRRGLPAPTMETTTETFAMATDPIEARLVALWEEVLGKRPIGIRDNFFELGGHSLLAARMMHRTGQALGKTLPLAMLFHAPTIERLAKVLREDEWTHHWSSLVPIQPSGSRPPFFCIHGIGGNVLGFHRLGRCMAPEYPFYGLQSRGMDGKNSFLTSIESMAAHYIAEMRSVQPHGPYFIGGFSFGGLVGYEIAQQLRKAGEETALLVLFDTFPGDVQNGTSSFFKMLLTPSRKHWFHDVPRALDKKIRRTWRTLLVPQIFRDLHAANRAAVTQYVLRPYPGKVTLVRATEKAIPGGNDPHAAWRGLTGELVEFEIASDHYDILIEPQVYDLAARLKAWIDAAQSEQAEADASLQASSTDRKSFARS
ncbi:MAG TPA: amino acid adenylation domain-containing protein [Terriglobales bacterium]|nr:amino acid adenylation domain-containing protein [Terriglobales bacterium]